MKTKEKKLFEEEKARFEDLNKPLYDKKLFINKLFSGDYVTISIIGFYETY